MNQMVNFYCPHCGEELVAPAHYHGKTLRCPECSGFVTLEVLSTKEVAAATIVGATLGILSVIFDN